MTRCVLYARLSVTKEESVSIARQLESGRNLATLRGWEVVGEFVDDGVSATANHPDDRRGWSELMRTPDFQAVIIWKVDRLARRVLDFLRVDEALQQRGAGLVAVEDPIDMTSPMGRAFATILAVFGEMEAAAIASRVKAARSYMVNEGRWPGGGIPYGYQPVPNPDGPGRVLVKDPERIEWLHRIVAEARGGKSINGIATWLSAHEAPPPRSSLRRMSEGQKYVWNRQTVEGLLRNPMLAGMTPRNPGRKKSAVSAGGVLRDDDGNPVVNESLSIMTIAEFDALQTCIQERLSASPQSNTRGRKPGPYFLSSLAQCADCHRRLYRGTNQKKAILYCPKCRQTINRGGLDAYVIGILLGERGACIVDNFTVLEAWGRAGTREDERGKVARAAIESVQVSRGKTGTFDVDRIHIIWNDEQIKVAA